MPKGIQLFTKNMPRYVILYHRCEPDYVRPSHWDLMLEHEGALLTWALELCPARAQVIQAERLPDHRLEYLHYEGSVSGDRGEVTRWDSGTYEILEQNEDCLVVRLTGERALARAVLDRSSGKLQFWTFSE